MPLGFGDNLQGYPLVGTTPAYFELRNGPQAPPYYSLEQGTVFSGAYGAVLGAGVARGVVAGSVLLEAALLSFIGILLGVVTAYLGVALVSRIVEARASLTLPTPDLSRADWWRGLVLLPVAVLFALLPALRAAQRSPLERL